MSETKPFDEREAIKQLVRWLPSGNVYMPRFAPGDWWENDLCAVTRAGYWTEFEVKLTRQDFLKDKGKDRSKWEGKWPDMVKKVEMKHDLLATTETGPARFYYAVREGIATEADMPAWAGLLVFYWQKFEHSDGGQWHVREVRKAPRRHSRKDPQIVTEIYRAAWFRGISKLL